MILLKILPYEKPVCGGDISHGRPPVRVQVSAQTKFW